MPEFLSRQERFPSVGSTNDVVRDWLAAGTPEVALAVADEQRAGRGRDGRSWVAPAGGALLLSLGFRPTWLPAAQAWRLAATTSLAMADAAEEVAGLPDHAIRLKWPNDLVIETDGLAVPIAPAEGTEVRKVAGVLGESEGLGTDDPRVVIGLGIDTDWAAADFPPELADTMTSLREASHGRPIDHVALLDGFLSRLEVRIEVLRGGRFDVADWTERQLTTGRDVTLTDPDGSSRVVRAVGVDAASGALVIADENAPAGERPVVVGEIRHVRLARPAARV
jgi:BirA family transcriptional regulator, biotin operon repressor / biotin---[acetyl-CoA-carboxylase] ligase